MAKQIEGENSEILSSRASTNNKQDPRQGTDVLLRMIWRPELSGISAMSPCLLLFCVSLSFHYDCDCDCDCETNAPDRSSFRLQQQYQATILRDTRHILEEDKAIYIHGQVTVCREVHR